MTPSAMLRLRLVSLLPFFSLISVVLAYINFTPLISTIAGASLHLPPPPLLSPLHTSLLSSLYTSLASLPSPPGSEAYSARLLFITAAHHQLSAFYLPSFIFDFRLSSASMIVFACLYVLLACILTSGPWSTFYVLLALAYPHVYFHRLDLTPLPQSKNA